MSNFIDNSGGTMGRLFAPSWTNEVSHGDAEIRSTFQRTVSDMVVVLGQHFAIENIICRRIGDRWTLPGAPVIRQGVLVYQCEIRGYTFSFYRYQIAGDRIGFMPGSMFVYRQLCTSTEGKLVSWHWHDSKQAARFLRRIRAHSEL